MQRRVVELRYEPDGYVLVMVGHNRDYGEYSERVYMLTVTFSSRKEMNRM